MKSDVVGDVDVCEYTSDSPDDGCGYEGGLACEGDRQIKDCDTAASGSCADPLGPGAKCKGDWRDDNEYNGINNCSAI